MQQPSGRIDPVKILGYLAAEKSLRHRMLRVALDAHSAPRRIQMDAHAAGIRAIMGAKRMHPTQALR